MSIENLIDSFEPKTKGDSQYKLYCTLFYEYIQTHSSLDFSLMYFPDGKNYQAWFNHLYYVIQNTQQQIERKMFLFNYFYCIEEILFDRKNDLTPHFWTLNCNRLAKIGIHTKEDLLSKKQEEADISLYMQKCEQQFLLWKEKYNRLFSFVKTYERLPVRGELYYDLEKQCDDLRGWYDNQLYYKRNNEIQKELLQQLSDVLKKINESKKTSLSIETIFDDLYRKSIEEERMVTLTEYKMLSSFKKYSSNYKFKLYYRNYLLAMRAYLDGEKLPIIHYKSSKKYRLFKSKKGGRIVSNGSISLKKNRFYPIYIPKKSYILAKKLRMLLLKSTEEVSREIGVSKMKIRNYEKGYAPAYVFLPIDLLTYYAKFISTSSYLKKYYDLFYKALVLEGKLSMCSMEEIEENRYTPRLLKSNSESKMESF